MKLSKRAPDRRIIRTRRLLRDAMTELMEEKGLEGITVSDLTEKADISRGTFYLHFKDKYDLLEQSESDFFNYIREVVNPEKEILIGLSPEDLKEPFPFLIALFTYIQEHADFLKVNLGPKGNPSFQSDLKNLMKTKLLENILTHVKKDDMLVPEDYLTAYLASAHLGVVQHWLENGMEVSPRDLALILSRTTFFGPAYVAGIR